MKSWTVFASAVLITAAIAVPADAGIRPYLRGSFDGSQLRMSDVNDLLDSDEAFLNDFGMPADVKNVGTAFGPHVSAGIWLFPAFRIGATYSREKSSTKNHIHGPYGYYYARDLKFDIDEVGAEAVIRIERLAGLSIGGQWARGHAEFLEGLVLQDPYSLYLFDATAERRRPTWAAFIGLDQTNDDGISGYVRAGYRFRNMGQMPGQYTESDGYSSASGTGLTIPMDYSGMFFTVGVGFDPFR